jgi:outer membrane protein
MKHRFLPAVLLATALPLHAQQTLTLQQAVDMAQKQGHAAQAAIASRDAARSRDHVAFARNLPSLSLSGEAPRYAKTITPVIQPDGSTLFVPIEQTTSNASATISQRLPFTGGDLSVTSSLQRVDYSQGTSGTRRWTSTPVEIELSQPVLRSNAYGWDDRIQDVQITAAERRYLEAREGVALQASNAFFDLYVARRTLDNAAFNAATNDTLYRLNKGRLEIGKIGENDLLQSELALLQARARLDAAKLDYDRALAGFRLAVNLPIGAPVDVSVSPAIPALEADTVVAVQQALRNRAQMSELEVQSLMAKRSVSTARLDDGPGAIVTASVGFNQTAPDLNLAFRDPLQSQGFRLGVEIPVFRWGGHRASIQAARMEQRRVEATVAMTREQLVQEAHFAALQLAQARRNVDIAAKADTVAAKRFEVAYNRYVIGKIGVDNLYIAQNEKDNAVNQFMQAIKGYWGAYYKLRQVTLYDFEKGEAIR